MGDMKINNATAVDSLSTKQQPPKAAEEVKKHLKNVKDIGIGAATGAAAGAVIGGLNPAGALIGGAAGAAIAAKKAAAAAEKGEAKTDSVNKDKVAPQKTEAQNEEKGKQVAKTALGVGAGALLLGVPGAAIGLALTTPAVTDKAKEAWNSIKDFMSKHADKMQAAADQ
ncbi:MAG: hypothetical protein IGS03_02880 [Candidatus Sericytochromatia bacterium]|nr:hypothetical protein [Candidatus Sericytochromatia bacterium]